MAKQNLFSTHEEYSKKSLNGFSYSREELMELFILENMDRHTMEKNLRRISMEYNAVDVPGMLFGSLSTVYRYFLNKTLVKRNGLEPIVSVFLGKWTLAGDILNALGKHFGEVAYDALTRDQWHNTIKYGDNIYYQLVMNISKVNINNPSYYLDLSKLSIQIMNVLITKATPCSPRKATSAELKALKLWNPSKLEKEFTKALSTLDASIKSLDEDKQREWAQVVTNLTKFVKMGTSTIEDGIEVDDITA